MSWFWGCQVGFRFDWFGLGGAAQLVLGQRVSQTCVSYILPILKNTLFYFMQKQRWLWFFQGLKVVRIRDTPGHPDSVKHPQSRKGFPSRCALSIHICQNDSRKDGVNFIHQQNSKVRTKTKKKSDYVRSERGGEGAARTTRREGAAAKPLGSNGLWG